MKRIAAALTLLTLLTAGGALADKGGHHKGISDHALNGSYVFDASGFDANDFSPGPAHSGEVAVLGIVNFDGSGHFTGTLNFTSADNGGDQAACSETLAGSDGSYVVNSDGTGTLSINFPGATASSGTINFNLVVPSSDGKAARILQSDAGSPSLSGVSICGESIGTLVLKGEVRAAIPNND